MARYTGSVCRLCRRARAKSCSLKGERCYSDKCGSPAELLVPGQHGKARKSSEYGTQLRAKQTAKRYYGVLESQFAEYFQYVWRKSRRGW